MPHSFKKENLDFNNVLKQWGVTDLGKLIGYTSSEGEGKKKPKPVVEEEKKAPVVDSRSVGKRVGLIESIMNENRQAQSKRAEADGMPQSMDALLASL